MIYTCYEMIRDCKADRAEGWRYLIDQYIPVMRKLLAHYLPSADPSPIVDRVLLAARKPDGLFKSIEPVQERRFVAEMRQPLLADLPVTTPAIPLDLETVAAAMEPLTLVEKQAVWLESMGYSDAQAGAMLRMDPATVEKVRAKGADLLRGKVDSWNRTLLLENGPALGREAAAKSGEECLDPKPFLDMLDGRTSWGGRNQLERHVTTCWHCIDHFCRLIEANDLMRSSPPLSEVDSARYRELMGVPAQKKKLFGFL